MKLASHPRGAYNVFDAFAKSINVMRLYSSSNEFIHAFSAAGGKFWSFVKSIRHLYSPQNEFINAFGAAQAKK